MTRRKRRPRPDTDAVMVRCSPVEKAAYKQLAAAKGYKQLAPWARSLMERERALAAMALPR